MSISFQACGPFHTNCYIISQEAQAVVIDPGFGAYDYVRSYLHREELPLRAIYLTHGHIDHVRDAGILQKEYEVPVYLHEEDQVMLQEDFISPTLLGPWAELFQTSDMIIPEVDDSLLREGAYIDILGSEFLVHHTPGHSPGSVMFQGELSSEEKKVIFGGDVLFRGGVGRVDLPLSDPSAMRGTLGRLPQIFEHQAVLYPGHGPVTTIAQELETNVFMNTL